MVFSILVTVLRNFTKTIYHFEKSLKLPEINISNSCCLPSGWGMVAYRVFQ